MLAPILPARLDQLHSTAIMRGAIFGAYPFTVAVVSLFVPQLIDRFGRKPLLVMGLAAEGALVILFGNVHVERHGGDNAALWLYLSLRVLTVRAAAHEGGCACLTCPPPKPKATCRAGATLPAVPPSPAVSPPCAGSTA